MSAIAITGVSGYLGRRLVARLERERSVRRIVGVDTAMPVGSPKLEFHQLDVRDPRLGESIAGCQTVVHLAFIHDPIKDVELMRSVNVDGTRAVVEAAIAAGARGFVYPSSAMVYGAHPDNDVPLTEASPVRATSDDPYAWQKLETERLVTDAVARAGIAAALLRFAIVLGPNVENFVSRMFEAPRVLMVRGYDPPFQCIHEEDVASALAFAALGRLDGVYNVGAEGWLTQAEILQLAGKRAVELPEGVAFSMAERLYRAGLTAAPPSELHYLMHPWVIDSSAIRERGWKPRYTNADALREMLEASRSFISIGRARMRKESLAKGAAATLGAVGTMALVRRRRRHI